MITASRRRAILAAAGWLLAAAGVAGAAGAGEPGAPVALKTRELSLGKALPGIVPESIRVSPDGRRIAYAVQRGGKWRIVVDGAEGKEYTGLFSKLRFESPTRLSAPAMREDELLRVEISLE